MASVINQLTATDRYIGMSAVDANGNTLYFQGNPGDVFIVTGAMQLVSGGMRPRLHVLFWDASKNFIGQVQASAVLTDNEWHLVTGQAALSAPNFAAPAGTAFFTIAVECEYVTTASPTTWNFADFRVLRNGLPVYFTLAANNLILNAGFEFGSQNWSLSANASFLNNQVVARSGLGYLQISGSAAYMSSHQVDALGNLYYVPVTPGQVYTISGWIYVAAYAGNMQIDVTAETKDASFNHVGWHNFTAVTGNLGAWQYFSTTFTVEVGAAWINVYCEVNGGALGTPGACTILFDDLNLVQGSGSLVFSQSLGTVLPLYYPSIVTSQYQASPKLTTSLRVISSLPGDVAACARTMPTAFDINSAVGAQLDVLGTLIGASRTLPFQPSGGASPILTDADYKTLLLAKIAQNQWNGSLSSLYALWNELFPGGRISLIDNQNMTATIILAGTFSSIVQDMITNGLIVPRPQAVLYNYTFATLPILGFDQNNATIAGLDAGHFS